MDETVVIEPTGNETTLGRTPQAELELRVRDELTQRVERIRTDAVTQARDAVLEELRQAVIPNRSTVSEIAPNTQRGDVIPVRSDAQIRVTPSEDYYYRSLPAHMREYRKPETDYWIAEWIRGLANIDGRGIERRMRAEDKMNALSRAVLAEQPITAASGLSTGTGGALIPLPFANVVIKARDRISKMRALCTKFISDANSLRVPVSAVVTVAISAEGTPSAAGEGALTSKLLSKRKVQGNFSASIEMLQDSAINIVTYFSERVGSAIGAFEDTEICTTPGGSAVRFSEGLGFSSPAITEIAPAPATQINYAGINALFFGVPQQYRNGAVWMIESSVLALISAIKDTTGRPLFAPQAGVPLPVTDVSAGVIGSIFGRPVYDVPLAAGKMVFGDPSFIGLLDGGGIDMRVSEHAGWATDAIAYRFNQRTDSTILLADAFRRMIGITTSA